MLKYVIRRVLYMLPTVLGVIIVTFFLFGYTEIDSAASALGSKATAKSMEEFDQDRGYNKPQICGFWGTTRAYKESRFEVNAGRWSNLEGVSFDQQKKGRITLAGNREYQIPLALRLNPSESYRWVIRCRSDAVQINQFLVYDGSNEVKKVQLETGKGWSKFREEVQTPANASNISFRVRTAGGPVEVDLVRLDRGVAHFFDSQFFFFLKQILRLDFGVSSQSGQKVTTLIFQGILPSLSLTVPMFVVGLVVSITLALLCAFYRDTMLDRIFVVTSVVLMSVNYLVWIVLGQFLLGFKFNLFPVWGFESWQYLVLPCLIGVVSGLGGSLRFYRTVMLDEMYRDYVRTAFAKGVSKRGVLFKHVLKNAMIPILTSVVMSIPFLYMGSLLLESFFGIPGLGRLSVDALFSGDVDVLRPLILVEAVIYVIANLITDICYAIFDPRVKLT